MARTSHANVLSLLDAAQVWNFDLRLPSIPGSNIAPELLTFKCKTSALPSSAIEPLKIELHGVSKQEAGRATYEHSVQATFLETIDFSTIQAFRAWRAYQRNWKNNSGTNSSAYKVRAAMDMYDNAGNVAYTQELPGFFPVTINEVSLDGGQTAAIELSITFSFDYVDDGVSF